MSVYGNLNHSSKRNPYGMYRSHVQEEIERDLDTYNHLNGIFLICYGLTRSPESSVEFLQALAKAGDFSKEGPIKLYDSWIVEAVVADESVAEAARVRFSRQRKTLLTWQQSLDGLILIDAKLVFDPELGHHFYVYEFPFLKLVMKIWELCPKGTRDDRIKAVARREFQNMYGELPRKGDKEKREQSVEEVLTRAASAMALAYEKYAQAFSGDNGEALFKFDLNEKLKERGLDNILIKE